MLFAFYLAAEIVSCLILIFVIYVLLRPLVSGAVYFPTSPENLAIILKMAEVRPGDKIADLGSGDGRILIAFAKAGAEAHGYEVNPLLVRRSRRAIFKAGLEERAAVHWTSFWRANLSRYDAVVVYGFPHIMKKLGEKLKRELAPGTKVISNIYVFPNWAEAKSENRVYLYIVPATGK